MTLTVEKKRTSTSFTGQSEISTVTYNRLKWIAIISTIIENIGFIFAYYGILPYEIYFTTRSIGKLSIPIFSYLIVECFYFTKDRIKHLVMLVVLAFLAETPYNFFLYHSTPDLKHLNPIFYCVIGFAMFMLLDIPYIKAYDIIFPKFKKSSKIIKFLIASTRINIIGFFSFISYFVFNIDWFYIVFLGTLYLTHGKKHSVLSLVICFMVFVLPQINDFYVNLFYLIDLPLIILFRNTDKKYIDKDKSVFSKGVFTIIARYYYPIHLIILSFIEIVVAVIIANK